MKVWLVMVPPKGVALWNQKVCFSGEGKLRQGSPMVLHLTLRGHDEMACAKAELLLSSAHLAKGARHMGIGPQRGTLLF